MRQFFDQQAWQRKHDDTPMADIGRALNLRIIGSEKQAKRDFAVLLTVHVMNYLHSGGYEVAL